ncbi:hypothetical protein ICE94_02910 [Polynucleobacter sp. MWH-Loch1C5]|uniref:capsule assembly Wzi family protein n=1 Tax=Polynucleobacter sp. MWH-Loch1C5 TaxID=2689108 RepID=UPI001C0C946F|nr:capsule assembly Wzi family protein [Polynucleobacter sp. MWH-Loch1C5]MBU3542221.1 hypothetical protein [Polynucleobacter sp. MWH-Loch1C5]
MMQLNTSPYTQKIKSQQSSITRTALRQNLLLRYLLPWLCFLPVASAQALGPSVPYMPTWQARHHIQLLADHAQMAITTTHWPLPLAAVQEALDDLPKNLPPYLENSKDVVQQELRRHRWQGEAQLQLRERADAPVGFGENYTPGSSLKLTTNATEFGPNDFPVAAKLGIRVEESPNSLQTRFDGIGKEGRTQVKLDGTALVAQAWSFNLQAFAHNNWWGPGWQSSLISSNNVPPWHGFGVQRSAVKPSESKWLSWMGPWNLEFFVAQAQDPIVVANQPDGFLFIGSRLTLKPAKYLEVGLSRGVQTSGTGRPGGWNNFMRAFTSQGSHTNQNATDPGNQIAGYDIRLSCPSRWRCAGYYQWIGEDSSGQSGLPNQFMTLGGAEHWLAEGRHRLFMEYTQTFTHSLPWNRNGNPQFFKGPGYTSGGGFYNQGYTNGGRWIGSSFGGSSRVLSIGWMDLEAKRVIKLHKGHVGRSIGAYDPDLNAPHADLKAASIAQSFQWKKIQITPELMYTHLSDGQTIGANKKNDVRGGVTFLMPIGQ